MVFLGAHFLGQVVKRGKSLDTHQKRRNWMITEKLIFGYFFVCVCVFFLFFAFCCFSGFLGGRGFKGQVRWPRGPPHLALNPPSFFAFSFAGLFVFFGGFSLSLLLSEKLWFPPNKGHFCLFLSVSLCFSWAFFGLPLVQFLFLCLSLVLFFLSSFLSFSFCFLLVPFFLSFFIFLSSLLLFHEN